QMHIIVYLLNSRLIEIRDVTNLSPRGNNSAIKLQFFGKLDISVGLACSDGYFGERCTVVCDPFYNHHTCDPATGDY
ncbi:hypothetical protein PFISCL1PPCAC_28160, partial [Pristionchus fissidentatus]